MLAKLLIVLLSFHNNHRLTALYMETFRWKGITNSAVSIEIAIVPEIYTLLGIRSSGGHWTHCGIQLEIGDIKRWTYLSVAPECNKSVIKKVRIIEHNESLLLGRPIYAIIINNQKRQRECAFPVSACISCNGDWSAYKHNVCVWIIKNCIWWGVSTHSYCFTFASYWLFYNWMP